jgi:outer membrane protein TolC
MLLVAGSLWPFSRALAQKKLTLADCYALAKEQYPLSKQKALLQRAEDFTLDNAFIARLPQVTVNGQATYQSDVTQVPIKLPGISIESPPKDQYKIYAEVNENIYSGGALNIQEKMVSASTDVEEQKLEVELYKLQERINHLYFGILLIQEQVKQVDLMNADIDAALKKMNAALQNGTALKTNVYSLKAERLKNEQRITELKAAQQGYRDMLGLLIGETLDETTILEKPLPKNISTTVQRPELNLLENQKMMIDLQERMVTARNMPKLSLFGQAGYGRPALNMLESDFNSYFIGGLRFTWQLSGFLTSNKEKELLQINRDQLNIQKENFIFNTTISFRQQSAEISKYQQLLQSDKEIVALRQDIRKIAATQLENGIITSSDYLRELDAEDIYYYTRSSCSWPSIMPG